VEGRKVQEPKGTWRLKGKSNHSARVDEQIQQTLLQDFVSLEFSPLLEKVTVLLTSGNDATNSGGSDGGRWIASGRISGASKEHLC